MWFAAILSTLNLAEVVAPVTVVNLGSSRMRSIACALLFLLASSADGLVFLLRSRAESDLATTSFQVVPAELTG